VDKQPSDSSHVSALGKETLGFIKTFTSRNSTSSSHCMSAFPFLLNYSKNDSLDKKFITHTHIGFLGITAWGMKRRNESYFSQNFACKKNSIFGLIKI